MGKSLYIAEKPSVAQEFAKALHVNSVRKDGYLESEDSVVTWCVGHLVTMSYPEVYDEKYKRWSLATLPFIPEKFLYEVIPSVKKQFQIVSGLLKRKDVDAIYVCTDSGREGEYIYRLVEQMAGVKGKVRKRVWIDSQTEEEILHGIQTAKDLSEYDNLASSAYLRAKEDYLMGINFSRLLSLKYGNAISNYLGTRYTVISVGRVMTCVLGMVVRREWEIRNFVKTPFYRVVATQSLGDGKEFPGEFRAVQGSDWYQSPKLYKENGFKEEKDAKELIRILEKGFKVIIAGAGMAAHLPGMCAAIFPMPVIGIPMHTTSLGGRDSLYSIVQMPTGIPVATVAINGGANAGILAAKILATSDEALLERLKAYSQEMKEQVVAKAEKLDKVGYKEYMNK